MKLLSTSLDKWAISFSMLCVLHCLAVPLLLILVPSMSVLPLENEAFHIGMVIAVIPTSLFALTLGCKKHKRKDLLAYGLVGLSLLVIALAFGESHLGELGEKTLTVIGALIIAAAHLRNFSLCQKADACKCGKALVH
ncbi:MerC domain-containing protein [Thalassotalea agarivorans]|uniref:MerC mercury resistance protein n=1 Tax=Thalassotalea agarivorans TaxID=349064 RepID=A0A1I0CYU9_THASX|nr:MerC domain-containing protein [Thalassotalea agarivorans]SET25046.1 MerC mercury resistance protein [Thalassotalea agarivorans]